MDISQATKEPLPSHGQHQLFGRDYNTSIRHRCQTSLHPNNPRGLGLAECQGKKAFEPKGPSIVIDVKELPQSDAPKEDTTRNTVAARPKPEQGKRRQRRRRHRTGQRHGKAFASVCTLPTQAPHIDGHTIVHDVSQAVNPRHNLPSPTLLCCTDQNRPRRPRDRSSKLG
uniref:Uncharacterized protein n=1 Tax=Oryza meridionalis TaxID=40149 RepID=A0A0E0BZC5_9ORYZ